MLEFIAGASVQNSTRPGRLRSSRAAHLLKTAALKDLDYLQWSQHHDDVDTIVVELSRRRRGKGGYFL